IHPACANWPRPRTLPVVFTRAEVDAVLQMLPGTRQSVLFNLLHFAFILPPHPHLIAGIMGAMHAQSPRPRSGRSSLITWLATNTSGVPRAQARRILALGLVLGLVLGLLTSLLAVRPFTARVFGILGGVLGGATLGALGAVLAARLLDWVVHWSDPLLGF